MKIGALIPTRGDRPELLKFALDQMSRQTRKPDIIQVVNDPPVNQNKDITWRYRIGCERIFKNDIDVVLLIEDDDWYDPTYIERMVSEWDKAGKPQIFGVGETTYYHLGIRAYNEEKHFGRASAMSTLLTRDVLGIQWPNDNYVFTDVELWKKLKGSTCLFERLLSLGVKHGIGLTGGIGHNKQWAGYKQKDPELDWLKKTVDEKAFEFYKNISERIK